MIVYDEYPPEVIIDILNASFDHLKNGGSLETDPYVKFDATERVKSMKIEYEEQRSGLVLIQAIRECAKYEIAMPDWVAKAFLEQSDKMLNFEVRSWDDVFGKMHNRKHLDAQRVRKKKKNPVFYAVMERRQVNQPVDEHLFSQVGEEHGIKKSLVSDLYYEKLLEFQLGAKMLREAKAKNRLDEFSERQDKWLEKYGHLLKGNQDTSAK